MTDGETLRLRLVVLFFPRLYRCFARMHHILQSLLANLHTCLASSLTDCCGIFESIAVLLAAGRERC